MSAIFPTAIWLTRDMDPSLRWGDGPGGYAVLILAAASTRATHILIAG